MFVQCLPPSTPYNLTSGKGGAGRKGLVLSVRRLFVSFFVVTVYLVHSF